MRSALVAAFVVAVLAPPAAAGEPVVAEEAGDRVVIADSAQLVFRAADEAGVKMLSDVDREAAETIMAINRTRGTWQSYLLYTTPEMKVPVLRPGFTFTFGPPSKEELERRRRAQAKAERRAADRAPQPAAPPSAER